MREIARVLKNIFFPEGRTEKGILFLLWSGYFSYSACIVLNTYVIDHPSIPYDIYFGFDNQSVFREGVQNVTGHPLMQLYLQPFMFLGDNIALLFGAKAKTILVVFLCCGLISYSALFIYRYLKNIIKLETQISILLTVFYAVFSTSLTLAFTPESFTISAFLLTLSLWYLSSFILQEKEIPFITYFLLTFITGGITISNAVKTLFIPLLEKTSRRHKLGVILITALSLTAMVIKVNMTHHVIRDAESRITIFADRSMEILPVIQKVTSHFFGAPVLFPSFQYKIDNSFYNETISVTLYNQFWQYGFSILLIIAGMYAMYHYRSNRLMQMLILFFSVDFCIHLIIRYGLDDAFLYGGHWVFLIPVLLGWLYQSLQNDLSKKIFTATLVASFFLLLINNGYRLTEFYHFASSYYHV